MNSGQSMQRFSKFRKTSLVEDGRGAREECGHALLGLAPSRNVTVNYRS